MELNFTTNAIGQVKFRVADLHGRKHYVVPMALITPGVLNGSKGPLFYPHEEVHRNINQWNGMPLTLGHPYENGSPVSARSPGVLNKYSLGTVLNSRISKSGKLAADGWFDVELTRKRAPEIISAIEQGKSLELSTGLFTENVLAANGSQHNGKSYNHVAKNYKADHVAILLHEKGACSIRDGCGTLVDNCKVGKNAGKPGPCPDSELITKFNAIAQSFGYKPIPEHWEVFSKKAKPECIGEGKLCYSNALAYVKAHPDHKLAVGYVFSKEVMKRLNEDDPKYINLTLHGFVIDPKGRVVDPTLGKSSDTYVGHIIDHNKLKDGSDVRKVLFDQLDITTNGWSEAARIAAVMARRAGRSAKRVLKTAVKKKVGAVKSEVQRVREAIAKKGQGIVDKVAGKKPTPPPLPQRKTSAKPPPLPQKKDKPKPPPLPQKKDTTPYGVKEAEQQGKRSAVPEAVRVKRAVKKVREAKAIQNPRRSKPKQSSDSGRTERVARLRKDIEESNNRTAKAKSASKRIGREIKSTKSGNRVNTLKRKVGKAKAEARRQAKRVERLERAGEN